MHDLPPDQAVFPEPFEPSAEVTVGQQGGDLRGPDHRVVQAGIDYVASLGGGTVNLLPGLYECHDRVKLRSNVALIGRGPGVVLRKSNGFEMPLLTDGDYGEARVFVPEPQRWRVGMGVTIGDDATGGWDDIVATVVGVKDGALLLDRPLLGRDVLLDRGAWARHVFPVVEMVGVERCTLENLVIEGNKTANPSLNGCRGGAVYTYRSRHLTLRRLRVKDFNGDGVSFQTSHDVVVEGCEVSDCTGLGLHPGSGSQRPRVVGCHVHHNIQDGLFICWRVRHGVFADNLIESNGRCGLSIGHKDTENLIDGNRILSNGSHGLLFRPERPELAAHRCIVRRNTITDNGRRRADGCGIRVEGSTTQLTIENNEITCTKGARQVVGIWLGASTDRISLSNNSFDGHVDADLKREDARSIL